jgi:uncharacterized membrane protein
VMAGVYFAFSGFVVTALSRIDHASAYVLGMFVVTMLRNVPLNGALQAAEPSTAEAATTWARYLRQWTRWNHVRTVASTVASALFIFALVTRIGADR